MKFIAVVALAGMSLAPVVYAQKLELKLDTIAAKASQKAEVDLDGAMLKIILPQLQAKVEKGGKSPVGDLINGVQEIHVRAYEFEKAGAYSDQDLDSVRKQVAAGTGWSRVVNAKEKDGSAEIYVLSQGDKVSSVLILACDNKELAVVQIMGTLTVAQMKELVDSNVKYNLAALME